MLTLTSRPNPETAVIKLLQYLQIDIDPKIVVAELDKHPDYPSMLAVSDVLNSLEVENSAFRISNDDLEKVTCPFMVHTYSNGGEFAVVNRITTDSVYLSNHKWNHHKLDKASFKNIFGGIVLVAEPSTTSTQDKTTKNSLSKIKAPALFTGCVIVLAAALYLSGYFNQLGWQLLTLGIFKSAGLITAVLLLVQSIDSNNPLVQVLCQTKGKTNCNAILSSKAAIIFKGLTWSEVGFFYFAGTWLLLLFGGFSIPVWQALVVLNIISLPYTFYSIYHQARVAKQWCVLCCTVQALLWLEFVPLVTVAGSGLFLTSAGWNAAAVSTLVICLVLPVMLWVIIKPLFLKLQQLQPLKDQLRTFKYNEELFKTLLKEQPRFAQPDDSWCIVLGNVEANNVITMVTNPFCPPCATTHRMLDELLSQNGDVQARIVFTANNSDNDIKTPVARHMMALNELPDKTIVRRALHDWYEQKQKSYEAWARTYPVEIKESEFYKIDRQNEWCQMAEVAATPTLLLNGYRLPQIYQLPDLKYMLN